MIRSLIGRPRSSAATGDTVMLRDAGGGAAVAQLTETNAVFVEAPAVGTGRVYQRWLKLTGQPADYMHVGRVSDNTGETMEDWIMTIGPAYNVGADFLRVNTAEHGLALIMESRYKQGADWLWEVYLQDWDKDDGTVRRSWAVYGNLETHEYQHRYQAASVAFATTAPDFTSSVDWMTFTPVVSTYLGQLYDHIFTTDSSRHRIGQSGSNNFFSTWVYNATPSLAEHQLGTWTYANPIKIDASILSLQTLSNGSVKIGSSTSTVGAFGVTPVARQTLGAAASDAGTTQTLANAIRTALINLGWGQA